MKRIGGILSDESFDWWNTVFSTFHERPFKSFFEYRRYQKQVGRKGKISVHLQNCAFFRRLQEFSFVERIILHGSRARGDHREDSDLNFAIDSPNATDWDWLQLRCVIGVGEIETMLYSNVVRFDELSSSSPLYQTILKEGILLYQRDPNQKETPRPIRKRPTQKRQKPHHDFPDFSSNMMGVKALQFDEVYVDLSSWRRPPDIVPHMLQEKDQFFLNPHRYTKMPQPAPEKESSPASGKFLTKLQQSLKRFLRLSVNSVIFF